MRRLIYMKGYGFSVEREANGLAQPLAVSPPESDYVFFPKSGLAKIYPRSRLGILIRIS